MICAPLWAVQVRYEAGRGVPFLHNIQKRVRISPSSVSKWYRGKLAYKVPFRRVRITIFAMAKQGVLHNHSYVAALVIQHDKRLRSIMLSSVACPSHHYFSYIITYTKLFSEKRVKNKIYVLISLHLFPETFPYLRKIHRDIIVSVYRSFSNVNTISLRF